MDSIPEDSVEEKDGKKKFKDDKKGAVFKGNSWKEEIIQIENKKIERLDEIRDLEKEKVICLKELKNIEEKKLNLWERMLKENK